MKNINIDEEQDHKNEEIDLKHLFNGLVRNKFLIGSMEELSIVDLFVIDIKLYIRDILIYLSLFQLFDKIFGNSFYLVYNI